MTAFHSRQSGDARRTRKNENTCTFNFTSQIPPSICAVMHTKHDKSDATIFKSLCKRTVVNKCFYTREALPLVRTRFLRLANSSPKTARSPARRSRDGRATSGKTAGEISRVMSAQLPGNSRATATAMPPDGRADNSQANLPCAGLGRAISARILARRLATRSRDNRATVKATSCKTTRSNLNHDIQRL
jgi:hypothetical protein